MWDAAKAMFREKFIALNDYITKEKSKINYLRFHSEKLEKQEQSKPKIDRKKTKTLKSKNQWNRKQQRINTVKIWLSDNINKFGKSIVRLVKQKRKSIYFYINY